MFHKRAQNGQHDAMQSSDHDRSPAQIYALLSDLFAYLANPKRFFVINFLGGIFRGLGFAIGFAVLGALVVLIVQNLALHNLPGIGDFFAEIVRIVQLKLY